MTTKTTFFIQCHSLSLKKLDKDYKLLISNKMAVKVRRCTESFSFIKKCYSTVVVNKKSDFTEVGFENAKPFDSIPGPKPLPIIGNLWRFFPGIGTYSGLGQQELSIRYFVL